MKTLMTIVLSHLVVCSAIAEPEHSYDIKYIRNIMGAWTVDADENILVKYKVFTVDKEGNASTDHQRVITHVLYEGNITVQRPQKGTTGNVTAWIDDTAITYTASTVWERDRIYHLDLAMEPGDMSLLGFTFTGFIGLDTNVRMVSTHYPCIADHVYSVSESDDEVSIIVVPVGGTYERSYRVFVIGTVDQRIRRVEWWIKRPNNDKPTLILTANYLNWKSVNGKVRPTTLFRSSGDSLAGTQFEIVEIRPSVQSDLAVVPPSSKGMQISDTRIRFISEIGSTHFAIDSFQYRSSIPISGPPLNLEAVLAASTYGGGKAPRIAKPRKYRPEDAPHQISLLGEKVTIDVGVYNLYADRSLTIPLKFTNTTASDIPIVGWKTSCGNVKVTPQEAVISPGEQIDVELTVTGLGGGDQSAMIQPILMQGDEASTVQLTYRVEATYSTHVLNSVVRLDENQKGLLKLICISPYPPDSVVTYSASEGIEGTFSGWTEVNPKDKIGDCLGKLWRSSVEVTGNAVDDSWILLRTEKRSLGLFPVISDK